MQELEKILERGEIIAIEELEEENERCNRSCEGCCSEMEEGKCYCKDALVISAIKKLIERIELCGDGWISVEERLPEDDRYIFLSFENFLLPMIGRYEQYSDGSGNFYIGDEIESCIDQDMYVTAWRPLLEPYHPERSVH